MVFSLEITFHPSSILLRACEKKQEIDMLTGVCFYQFTIDKLIYEKKIIEEIYKK